MKNMKPLPLLFLFISVLLEVLTVLVTGNNIGVYSPINDIAVNCGSFGNSSLSERTWIGDAGDGSNYSPNDESHSSVIASARGSPSSGYNLIIYETARLSPSEFVYTFHLTAGPKFVLLHFFPSDYLNFSRADSFFSVRANGYTLLRNFSASLFSDRTGFTSFHKEFCLTVGADQILNVTFTPTPGNSDAYAFVNGIEVISMPESLYYNTVIDSKEGIKLAGQVTPYTFGTADALEAVKRLNIGGQFIGSAGDTGMYRTWDADDVYVTSSNIGVLPVNTTIQLNYSDQVPNYTAPDSVYRTARTLGTDKRINLSYNLTWSVEVDTNFYYLVRLHFCEFQIEINKPLDRVFEIFIDSQLVEGHADVISWSGKGMPVYRDYAVAMHHGQKKRTNLSVAMGALPDGSTLYSNSILNGLEIFKINDPDRNLAGLNPDLVTDEQPVPPPASKASSNLGKATKIAIVAGVASGFTVLSLLAFFIYWRQNRGKDSASNDGTSWWGPVSNATTRSMTTQVSSLPSDLCRHFSLAEIRAATNNFDEVFIIGVGGFGNVYKGYVDGGTTQVAIKRLNPRSQQGLHEFMTEIEMLSQLRHLHLVSLIGFCNDAGEMILVYDYMAHGTFRDHLYNTDNPPLPWKQRLQICTAAARGLQYLHTGAKHTIIHRDMKTTNILLDDKWVAKVSDFGLSRFGPASVSRTHVSTIVKGTFGYLDPEYCKRQQLTDKSDVYSFGVVLFEVLCARPVVNRTAPKEQINLVAWAQSCCKSGAVEEILDPHLRGAIAPECLDRFCEIAMSCLQEEGPKRPSMNDIVWGLEFALQLQVSAEQEVIDHVGASVHDADDNDDDAVPIGGNSMSRSDEVFM